MQSQSLGKQILYTVYMNDNLINDMPPVPHFAPLILLLLKTVPKISQALKVPESPKSTIISSSSSCSHVFQLHLRCILGTCEDQRSPRNTFRVRAARFAALPRGDLATILRMRPVSGIRRGTVVQGHTSGEQHLEVHRVGGSLK